MPVPVPVPVLVPVRCVRFVTVPLGNVQGGLWDIGGENSNLFELGGGWVCRAESVRVRRSEYNGGMSET